MTYNGHFFSVAFSITFSLTRTLVGKTIFLVSSLSMCVFVYRSQRAKFRLRATNALFRVRALAPGCLCGIGHGLAAVVNEVG